MDPRILDYYNKELQYMREMGAEFAAEFPKIAGRLGLEGMECADPYVERLLEGFAFLTARVQLKLDAQFPNFTRHMLEMICPHYLAPTPSMAVVQFQPDPSEGSLAEGFVVPRDSLLRSVLGKGDQTACQYLTKHEVTLWPLMIKEAEYFTQSRELGETKDTKGRKVRAGIRLRLRATAGLNMDKIAMDRLVLYLSPDGGRAMRLYEQIIGNSVAVMVQPTERPVNWKEALPASCIKRMGFSDEEKLLPYGRRSFQGYRLLHEYFAFPQRFLFVELAGLAAAMRRCAAPELDVIILLERADRDLEGGTRADDFALFSTPIINLFTRRADQIHLKETVSEYHIVADRTRPMDFEVCDVASATGLGSSADERQAFRPFYAVEDRGIADKEAAYYVLRREPRRLSEKQRRLGARSSYLGSEVFVSLVDGHEAPYSSSLRRLALEVVCTNRDLPLQMPIGQGLTDFTLEAGAPVEAVKCLDGPTKPRASYADGEVAWRLISHLSLNYLSLADTEGGEGGQALRQLLELYANLADAPTRKQIGGVVATQSRAVTRRLPLSGPITFGRGLEVKLTLDDEAFEGAGAFLLGAVLEEFLARYVSMNSFTETVIHTLERGEIARWPLRTGRRTLL